jgi:hypothetical protein
MKLVVVHEFGPYKRGTEITDEDSIAKIIGSENANKVVKVGAVTPPPKTLN